MSKKLTLSVVDQSPIRRGGTAADALHETIELAAATEKLGYERFWREILDWIEGSYETHEKLGTVEVLRHRAAASPGAT